MFLSSPAFRNGERVPKKYTGEAEDLSPPVKWSNVPERAAELVLLVEDPDAPQPEPWVHWLAYGIDPALQNGIPEGFPRDRVVEHPIRAHQGVNSFRRIGYGGPLPPPGHGPHRYFFRLFALKSRLDLAPGASKDDVLEAMQGQILAEAQLVGTYERRKSQAA